MMRNRLFTYFIPALVLLCLVQESRAQSPVADSLQRLLKNGVKDSARVDVLNAWTRTFFSDDPDSAVIVATSAKDLSERLRYHKGSALALKNIGYVYYQQGKYLEAFKFWKQAQEVYASIGDKRGVANMLSNQGAIYFVQGDEAKSLEYHIASLRLSEEIGDSLRIVTSLNNIGGIFQNKEATHDKALDYFLRSFAMSQRINDQYLIGTSAVNLGEFFFKKGDDAKALSYLKISAKAYEGTEDLPYTLNYIGRVYTREKDYYNAIKTHEQAFSSSRELDTKLDMIQSLIGLAQAYAAKGDKASSIANYKQSLDYAIPMNALTEMRDAYQGLTADYASTADFNTAFRYQELLLSIKDSMYNTDKDKKMLGMEFKYVVDKKESQIALLDKDKKIQLQEIRRQKLVRNGFIGGFGIVLLFAAVFFRQRNRIFRAKKRSEELLLNILPEETAEELKATGAAKAKSFEQVSVLFTDFKNFTQASEKLTPEELVAEINQCYSEFDRIITRYGIEKIKTIGDSYMCAGGLPVANNTHAYDVCCAALEIAKFIDQNRKEKMERGQPAFDIRIGIHTGPVVAGIVGIKKFSYDIWGDTVNTASRMESSGYVGKVNISGSTYELVKDKFNCTHRGKLEAKNKGLIDMYFVEGLGTCSPAVHKELRETLVAS